MLHTITVNQISHWTGLLWLTLAAIWLGSAPFVKPTIYKQHRSSRIENVAILSLGLYLLFGSSVIPAWANQPVIRVTVPVAFAGLGLVVSGLAFSVWARVTLGDNWSGSATVKQGHTLVRKGPYRVVRHPIYTGLLIAFLGSALEHGLVRSFLAIPICAVALWLKVMVEEELMINHFGEEYLRYRREVRALAPFIF